MALRAEKKGQGEREEGKGQPPHTHPHLSCRQPLWGPGRGTKRDKLIPKGLCPAGMWCSREARMSQEKMERWGEEEQGAGGEREEGREK